jgi:hypothetical protein
MKANTQQQQEKLTEAAGDFTHNLKSSKRSKFRDHHKNPPNSKFKSLQAHFAQWWAIGHQARHNIFSFIIQPKPEFTAQISHLFRRHENRAQPKPMGGVVRKN